MIFWLSLVTIVLGIAYFIVAIIVLSNRWTLAGGVTLITGIVGLIIVTAVSPHIGTEVTKNDLGVIPETEVALKLDSVPVHVESHDRDINLIYMKETDDGAEPRKLQVAAKDITVKISDVNEIPYVEETETLSGNGWLTPWTNSDTSYIFYVSEDDLSLETLEFLSQKP